MKSSEEASIRRARAVLRAGAMLADADCALGAEVRRRLVDLAVLSAQGVELALSEHLETSATDADLEALVKSVERAPRVHVLLSANVCVAALRALALALAAAPTVYVRPSRRDPVLAELLVEALCEDQAFRDEGATVQLTDPLRATAGDAVHLYGSDETLAAVRGSLPPGVSVSAHGTGFGVAVLGAHADIDGSAMALARDVVVFDQAGCLSPRVVLVEGDAQRVEAFARALHRTMIRLGAEVPRAVLTVETEADIERYVHTLQTVGLVMAGPEHVIGVDLTPRALVLPPPARVVHVARALPAGVPALLSEQGRFVTALGTSDDGPLAQAAALCAPHARRSALGEMQRPPLDGPVDQRPHSAD